MSNNFAKFTKYVWVCIANTTLEKFVEIGSVLYTIVYQKIIKYISSE